MAQDWTAFTLKIGIKASVQDIYQYWTQAAKMESWFLQSCRYSRGGQLLLPGENVQAGDTYAWTWYLYEHAEAGKIISSNGKDALQFTFAGTCVVEINLTETGPYTMVQLKQRGIPTDEASKFSIRIGCVQGWTFYLTNLKSVYEHGHDLHNKIPELKGVNN